MTTTSGGPVVTSGDVVVVGAMDMLDAALALVSAGFAIIPVHTPTPEGGCSCGYSNCESPGVVDGGLPRVV